MSRLFIALWPSAEATEQILDYQSALRTAITRQGVRFTAPDRIHLTLLFLGDNQDTDQARERFLTIRPRSLDLTTGNLGAFPSMYRPRTIWLGVSADGLEEHAGQITQALGSECAATEDPFVPHLTLARVSPGSKAVGRILMDNEQLLAPLSICWTTSELTLVESLPGGSYRIVETLH